MARIRSIKPEFFTSETIASLPISARLTFIGLWTYVDDNGVGPDNARLITAAVWPLEDDPTEALARTREDVARLHEADLIDRYERLGKRFLYVTTWTEHQKVSHPRKARFPLPDDADCVRLTRENAKIWRSSGAAPEDRQRTREALRPEQGAGSREQGAGMGSGENHPLPPATAEEGEEDEASPTPESTLIDEMLAARPGWSRRSVARVLHDPDVACRPWPVVRAAALAVAHDPASDAPGRLRCDGPWWNTAAAPCHPAADPKCDGCGPNRMVDLPDGRVARCPTCHPLRSRTASLDPATILE